jgi:hypothetical protein
MKQFRIFTFTISTLLAAVIVLLSPAPALLASSNLAVGQIAGIIWRDSNNNGIYDQGEELLADHPVYLQQVGEEAFGAVVAVVHTDGEGRFAFVNLEEGQYLIFAEEGGSVLVEVNSTYPKRDNVQLAVPVQFHQLFLPVMIR